MRPLVLLPLLWTLALLGPAAARAQDGREVELPLASGAALRGVVESADEREVVLRVGPEQRRRIPWEQLAPLGYWRVREALVPATDGEAHVSLAELAADLGLHAEVRAEYEKALALGAIDRARYDELVPQAERRAVEQGVAQARTAADAGDLEAAMEVARRLKLEFAGAPNAREIDGLIDDLLDRVRTLDAEAAKAAAELARAQEELARNKEILQRLARAAQEADAGDEGATAAGEARAKGNVTRAGRHAEDADGHYQEARRHLGRLRRILPPDHAQRREVLARLADLDRRQFALLLATAKFFFDQRVYSKAETWANRAAYLDPVHPDLVEIRDELRARRIQYRLSSITNARPIVR